MVLVIAHTQNYFGRNIKNEEEKDCKEKNKNHNWQN